MFTLGIIIGIVLCFGVLFYLHRTGKLKQICDKIKAVIALLKIFKPKNPEQKQEE